MNKIKLIIAIFTIVYGVIFTIGVLFLMKNIYFCDSIFWDRVIKILFANGCIVFFGKNDK